MAVAITGNTYPVKDQLRALGGRWNAERKAWMVPDEKAAAAAQLVQGAPKQARSAGYIRSSYGGSGYGRGKWTGCSCGSREGEIRASDCWTCKHDAE